jgi:hypothetical protein
MRSLTLLAGLKNSSLAANLARQPAAILLSHTKGVLPISSVISFAIFIAENLTGNRNWFASFYYLRRTLTEKCSPRFLSSFSESSVELLVMVIGHLIR